jgi:D-glycero-D-manno-heptose 1,7-bisphosphate phosphatase
MKSGVFFERDGILNLVSVEKQQQKVPLTLEQFQIHAEALAPLQELKAAGFVLIATTHQPELSRGHLTRRELDLMHARLRNRLPLDDILLCPHDANDDCPCRRPKPGLLLEAGFKWHLELDRSYVISDKWQDAHAAHMAGCTSILIRSPWNGSGHHDFVLPSLSEAVQKIFQVHSTAMCSSHSF